MWVKVPQCNNNTCNNFPYFSSSASCSLLPLYDDTLLLSCICGYAVGGIKMYPAESKSF
jgi:hypothetical protein